MTAQSGWLERFTAGLRKTRESLTGRLQDLFHRSSTVEPAFLDELEALLLQADFGITVTDELMSLVRQDLARRRVTSPEELRLALKRGILQMLETARETGLAKPGTGPAVLMFVGVNGTGKTTTVGKLAWQLKQGGSRVILAAADTFRAAATEQLAIWAQRAGVEIIAHEPGGDPAAVAYDALQAALARKADYLLVDTAGRLHTKTNLMEELKKVKRVLGRLLADAPHEILLVLDATTGQNALSQAEQFHAALGVTGLVLTKLDGTAKGGIVVAVARQFGLPVKLVGLGEGLEDLRPFEAQAFVEAILPES